MTDLVEPDVPRSLDERLGYYRTGWLDIDLERSGLPPSGDTEFHRFMAENTGLSDEIFRLHQRAFERGEPFNWSGRSRERIEDFFRTVSVRRTEGPRTVSYLHPSFTDQLITGIQPPPGANAVTLTLRNLSTEGGYQTLRPVSFPALGPLDMLDQGGWDASVVTKVIFYRGR